MCAMSDNLEREAVKLAVEGFRAVPVRPGRKEPLLVGWQRRASDDPITVSECKKTPTANIGVRTGGHIFVPDVDSYKPGTRLGIEIPTTTVKTARGGRHYYFAGARRSRANCGRVSMSAGRAGSRSGPEAGLPVAATSEAKEAPQWRPLQARAGLLGSPCLGSAQ